MIGVVGAGWVAVWGGTCSGWRCVPGRETQMLYMGNGVGADVADLICPPCHFHRRGRLVVAEGWSDTAGDGLPRRRFHLRAAEVYFGNGTCLADLQVYVDRSPTGNP